MLKIQWMIVLLALGLSVSVSERKLILKGTGQMEQTSLRVIKTDSKMDFYQESTRLSKKYLDLFENSQECAKSRLIVKASVSNLDFEEYDALLVIQSPDNYYIAQFDSVEAAKKAMQLLSELTTVEYVEQDEAMNVIDHTFLKSSDSEKS